MEDMGRRHQLEQAETGGGGRRVVPPEDAVAREEHLPERLLAPRRARGRASEKAQERSPAQAREVEKEGRVEPWTTTSDTEDGTRGGRQQRARPGWKRRTSGEEREGTDR